MSFVSWFLCDDQKPPPPTDPILRMVLRRCQNLLSYGNPDDIEILEREIDFALSDGHTPCQRLAAVLVNEYQLDSIEALETVLKIEGMIDQTRRL